MAAQYSDLELNRLSLLFIGFILLLFYTAGCIGFFLLGQGMFAVIIANSF